ncbi:glycosyltransferase [Pseudomonas sp. ALS1131]|nr:glycosyltransferase family 4 protein [Pseudomonas sp. ALS1131]TRO40097.1 glycosyltransferase [Pseudomonas sp. ALS1131]
MKDNILYVVSTLKRTGPTNQLFNLIRHLDLERFEPHVLTLSPEPMDSRWLDYELLGVRVRSLSLSRMAGVFWGRKYLGKTIEEVQPALIHTQGIRADILSASIDSGVPRVSTIRNFPQYDYAMTYGGLQSKIMLWRHIQAMRNLDLCIGVSQAVSTNLTQELEVQNVDVVSNGVDVEKYFPVTDLEKKNLRDKLGLQCGSEFWVSSGHLTERKNPLLIISAWKKIFGRDTTKQLIFLGDGDLKIECEKASLGCDNIHIVGRVENVPDYLKASDYFISASRAEGLPNAVLEALACGLPVLLSDIEPHREIWERDPKIGFMFDPDSQENLQDVFLNILQTDRGSQSRAALSLVEGVFSAKAMSTNYQDIYLKFISGAA